MPIYEYKCNTCDEIFEVLTLSSSSKEKIACPECQSDSVNKLISAGSIRAGSSLSQGTAPSPGCGGGSGFS